MTTMMGSDVAKVDRFVEDNKIYFDSLFNGQKYYLIFNKTF